VVTVRRLQTPPDDDVGELADVEEGEVPPSGVLAVGEEPPVVVDVVVGPGLVVELVGVDILDESKVVLVAGAIATGASAT